MNAIVIICTFIDGPLAGQQISVDLEKHNHTDRKTGAYYVRVTEQTTAGLETYFVLRDTLYGTNRITRK